MKIMEVIRKPIGAGKTTELIKMANGYNGYIVCRSKDAASYTFALARFLKCEINFPITYDEFLNGKYCGAGCKKFFIDDADELLFRISKIPIEAITISL